MHWRSRSLLGRAHLAWAAAGVGPPGSCLRTSCKCYRFLPINADLIKWSPDAGPEHCVPAFSFSLQNITLTGLLPHLWEGDTAKNLEPLHLRGLSDVPLSLPLCGQRQPEHKPLGGPWLLCLSPSLLPASWRTLCPGPSVSLTQCPAKPTAPPPQARHPLAGALAHCTPPLPLLMKYQPSTLLSKQGKGQLCTREQLPPARQAVWLPEG